MRTASERRMVRQLAAARRRQQELTEIIRAQRWAILHVHEAEKGIRRALNDALTKGAKP
jgi:hypothetical protein